MIFGNFFCYIAGMKFTRDFIKEQIELAVSQHPGKRAISVTLQTADPRRVFIISYDAVSGQIMGVLERVGRTTGNPVDMKTILETTRAQPAHR